MALDVVVFALVLPRAPVHGQRRAADAALHRPDGAAYAHFLDDAALDGVHQGLRVFVPQHIGAPDELLQRLSQPVLLRRLLYFHTIQPRYLVPGAPHVVRDAGLPGEELGKLLQRLVGEPLVFAVYVVVAQHDGKAVDFIGRELFHAVCVDELDVLRCVCLPDAQILDFLHFSTPFFHIRVEKSI